MRLLRFPGVYRPQNDTFLLCEALAAVPVRSGARVLDVCTGTGAVAITAARCGAGQVTAVDVSLRAVWVTRINAGLQRVKVQAYRGDLLGPVMGRMFDLITANPPYVSALGRPGRHSRARAWDAGEFGRDVVAKICAQAPVLLAPGGTLLMVHSALCGVYLTLAALREAGLKAAVVARRSEAFGPVMRSRAGTLGRLGLIEPGQEEEELVVIRADRIQP